MGAIRAINTWIGGPNSVRAQFTGSQLRTLLGSKNLRPELFYTIHRLKGLSVDKLNGMISLTDTLLKKFGQQKLSFELKLIVPQAAAIEGIDFEALLGSETAIEKLMPFVMPNNMKVIDLRELPWVYRNFVVAKNS